MELDFDPTSCLSRPYRIAGTVILLDDQEPQVKVGPRQISVAGTIPAGLVNEKSPDLLRECKSGIAIGKRLIRFQKESETTQEGSIDLSPVNDDWFVDVSSETVFYSHIQYDVCCCP
jgi:hypothetical protein